MGISDNIDLVKPIEGTNELQIYDPNLRKITKKTVNLSKNQHGYSVFPDGIRYTLINDKLFLTGGRDWSSEFKVVLCYELSQNKISRLPDMISSHSYHAILSSNNPNEHFFIVIGGENNVNCELFDLSSNSWKCLPCLNNPRGNASLYLFDYRYIYVFCGFKTEIHKNEYIDSFERLELSNLSEGWRLLDYKNNSGVDMRFDYTGIMPVTPCQVFIYGGFLYRSTQRVMVIYDLVKNEVLAVDEKILEDLRQQFLKDPNFKVFYEEYYERNNKISFDK